MSKVTECARTLGMAIVESEEFKNMQITDMEGFCYKSTYTGSKILTALNTIYPLSQLDHKYYLPTTLNKKFKKISG